MEDAESATRHAQRLAELFSALRDKGLAVYEHEHVLLAFGSFRLEVGTRRRRWGFSWDGREGYMTHSESYPARDLEGKLAPPVEGTAVHLGLGPEVDPYAFIRDFEYSS